MNNSKSMTELLSDSASEFWSTIGGYLPKVFGAIVLLILAIIVAKLAQTVVVKGLELAGLEKLRKNKNVAKTLKSAELDIDYVAIAGRVIFWVIIVIFAIAISDVLQLTAMRDVISEILAYLPNVIAAAIILTVAVAGARLVRDTVTIALRRMRVDYAHTVASFTYYVLVVFGVLIALDQLGFQTTILTANITVIVAGVMLALALAFGLGGRDLAGRLLESAYQNAKKSHNRK